jgi:hypothetical protein
MRTYRARGETQDPVMEKVRFSDLVDRLPADTSQVTPADRAAALTSRRAKYLNAYGD